MMRIAKNIFFFLPLLLASVVWVQPSRTADSVREFDHAHSKWSVVLHDAITTENARTQVKLDSLVLHDQILNQYLSEVESVTGAVYSRFSEPEKAAFAINAFNAAVVRFILDCKKPSLKQCGRWYKKYNRMPFLKLLGKKYSMDEVRSDWIRFKFKDPRMLFVLFDGTSQSPPIPLKPVTGTALEPMLELAEKAFMRDRTRNRYDPRERKVHVARLFKKFWSDFEEKQGPLKSYFSKWLADRPEHAESIAEPITVIVIEDEDLRVPLK